MHAVHFVHALLASLGLGFSVGVRVRVSVHAVHFVQAEHAVYCVPAEHFVRAMHAVHFVPALHCVKAVHAVH